MKISTIILLSVCMLRAFSGNAQAVHATSGAYYITGSSDSTLVSHVRIINTGSVTLMVQVSRDLVSLTTGHQEQFCWGITCYSPGTPTSTHAETILPGDTNSTFIGYLYPHGHNGTSIVNYLFFDVADPSDTVSVMFTYDFPTGIRELSGKATITNASPNPADGLTSLSYNLNSAKDARLVIYNVLGTAVKEIKLTDKSSTLIITTSDLKSGVYFYSLIADGKSVASKKLIVAHR